MKFIQFDIRESAGDRRDFVSRVIRAAKAAGFVMPILSWDKTSPSDIEEEDIFMEIVFLLDDIDKMTGLKYYLRVDGPLGVITDEHPGNAKKEKALRKKLRKAWALD